MPIDITERVRRYIAHVPPSIQGSGGSKSLKHCAMVLVHGFDLNEGDALSLIKEWNNGCQPPWSDKDLERIITRAPGFTSDKEKGYLLKGNKDYTVSRNTGVSAAPKRKDPSVPKFQPELLKRVIQGIPDLTREDFKRRSPVPVEGITSGAFLEHLYKEGERILIFEKFFSQGDFLWEVGRGGFRLADTEGVKAVRSKLPIDGGKDGIWFLSNPVSGKWEKNPLQKDKKTRRSKPNITAWRYAVLESDEAPEADWLKLLAFLDIPIAAVYSSGGKSLHALVCVDQGTYEHIDHLLRQSFKKNLCPLGADGGALSAVRLTRLPCCTRGGRLQELIYLNPDPHLSPFVRILDCPPKK